MGRTAKPSEIKRIEGNPGKRKVNKAEPKGRGGPITPENMTTLGQVVWKRVIASMPDGIYTGADQHLLCAYCEAVARHMECSEEYTRNPVLLERGSTGQLVENPVLKIMRSQAQMISHLGARLGLDPVARQALHASEDAPDDGGFNIH